MKGSISCLLLFVLLLAQSAPLQRIRAEDQTYIKKKSTYYTAEKVANARRNVQRFEWARDIKDNAVQDADRYLSMGLDRLWQTITPQSIPRSFAVNLELGSPITGKEFNKKYGYRGWVADPMNRPWKLVDPSSGYVFPTNDFASYYQSGLNEHGIFDPKRADPKYLVNELYPEKGKNWGVDDGRGWVDEQGNRWTFIAYYNHWHVWHGGIVDNALRAFRDAYLYTGDAKYAQAGTILLDRIADVYPDMDLAPYPASDGFLNSHGGTGKGKIRGSIWEATAVTEYLSAYDAFFPGMEQAEIVPFLREKAEKYQMANRKDSVAAIRKNIEEGLLKQIFPAIKEAKIRGNFGMHQRTLAMAAVVLDEPGVSEQWIDWIFQSGGLVSNPDWHLTGGNVLATLVNQVDRDGFGDEPSTEYNSYWLRQIQGVADILDSYTRYPQADLYKQVKFRKMFDTRYPLIMSDRYTPMIGDSYKTGIPFIVGTVQEHVKAFEKFGDPVYAQTAYLLNGHSMDNLHGDIFSADPEKVIRDIQEVIRNKGPLQLKTTQLSGFGFTAFRHGQDEDEEDGVTYPFSDLKQTEATADTSDHLGSLYMETDDLAKHIPEAFDMPESYYEESPAVQLLAKKPGERLSFTFDVPKTDHYEVAITPLKSASYGRYEIQLDGTPVKELDFYGPSGSEKPVTIARQPLSQGSHTLTFVNRGKRKAAAGYKMGVLRLSLRNKQAQVSSDSDSQRGIWMYYGRNQVGRHGHKDTLNLGIHGFGLDLSPDLGYPDSFKTRTEWVSNTVAHNTVVVDRAKQKDTTGGIPRHVETLGRVQLVDVEAPRVYPQTDLYRRTTAYIPIDKQHSYAVDLFRIHGGEEHHFSFHGAEGDVATEGLRLIPQEQGTYAGPDVPFGQKEPDQPEGWDYAGSGFHYLKNVERDDRPSSPFSVDWKIRDTWGVLEEVGDIHLRLTMLNAVDEAALADGIPPQLPGNPDRLRYFLAKRSGSSLKSQFVSVIEAYKDQRDIRSIEAVPVTPADGGDEQPDRVTALKVTLKNGRVDTIFNSLDADREYIVDGRIHVRGFFAVLSEKGGTPAYAFVSDGTLLQTKGKPLIHQPKPRLEGNVLSFTRDLSAENEITVQLSLGSIQPKSLLGRMIHIHNDNEQNAVYTIRSVEHIQGDQYRLQVGDTTLVRRYTDPDDFSKGFVYNIREGDALTIPLSAEWRPE
ncbi:hypothetical protein GCM10011571_30170 [Marinithermofilum abyssi]|uniref:Heparinase II/III-like protein n=1 Tax=Marinithermofilum abyssi TaxID=1571185 RepID=A0A8J2YB12_9BACL|nr:heparinase II/III family protein [Marinithermofilum abyssi]GGE26010.1 hypothetical protein GCM10011571_30170 [Marinithermofilum abyssi]